MAENGPTTQYTLIKEAKLTSFTANYTLRSLHKKGLTKYRCIGEARTGKKIKKYFPSFLGFVMYFAIIPSEIRNINSSEDVKKFFEEREDTLVKVINNAKHLYPEEILFTEWFTIKAIFGINCYILLCNAAIKLVNKPFLLLPSESSNTSIICRREEIPKNLLQAFTIKSFKYVGDKGCMLDLEVAFIEEILHPIFNPIFTDKVFNGYLEKVPNKRLYEFFKKKLDLRIRQIKQTLSDIKLTKNAFKVLFKE